MHRTSRWLLVAIVTTTLVSFAGISAPRALAGDTFYTAVCISAFESPIHVEWLTEEQIDELNAIEPDPFEPPPPQIVGYPDPATGSCATENGELKPYDPEDKTPICVRSGPDQSGPLIVQFAFNIYLPGYDDVILADPVTGECPDISPTLVETLVAELIAILQELLG